MHAGGQIIDIGQALVCRKGGGDGMEVLPHIGQLLYYSLKRKTDTIKCKRIVSKQSFHANIILNMVMI